VRSVVSHVGRARVLRSMTELLVAVAIAVTVAVGLLLRSLGEHGVDRSVVTVVTVGRAHAGSTVVADLIADRTVGAGVRGHGVGSAGAERSRVELTRRQDTGRRDGTGHAVELVVVFLDLAGDATTVRSVADRLKDGTDVVDETNLGLRIGVVHGSLDDVVGVRVAEQLLEIGRVHNLIDESTSGDLVASTNRLLNDVGAELLSRESGNVTEEALSQRLREGGLAEVENVLHDIVAEGILDKSEGVHGDVLDKLTLLVARSMVDTTLQDAAAMTMSADNDTASANSVEDELGVLGRQVVETLLDDVVAVEVLDERNDFPSESLGDDLDLLRSRNEFDHLLQSAGTVLVERNLDHGGCGCADENGALVIVGVLEQLLTEVVAERICANIG
jgi:hypothetical protein